MLTHLPKWGWEKKEGLLDKLGKWNLVNPVVIHPAPSHNRFPMDGALVGAGGSYDLCHLPKMTMPQTLLEPFSQQPIFGSGKKSCNEL
jgi:hypothetical protein